MTNECKAQVHERVPFSKRIIDRISTSSRRVTETVSNTQSANDEANSSSNNGVSALQKAERAIQIELIDPLRTILRGKSKAMTKCDFLRSCLAHNTLPKGTTPCVTLKINDTPRDLVSKWNEILQNCGRQLTLTLINYHENQIAEHQRLAEERIMHGNQMILPEFITSVPDIPVKIENAFQDLLCEISITTKRLRKRPSTNPTPKSKKTKVDNTSNPITSVDEPTSSKNFLQVSHSPSIPKPSKNESKNESTPTPTKKRPWRPLKLKKKGKN